MTEEIEIVHPRGILLCEHGQCKAKRTPAMDYEREHREKAHQEPLTKELKEMLPYRKKIEYMPIALCQNHAKGRIPLIAFMLLLISSFCHAQQYTVIERQWYIASQVQPNCVVLRDTAQGTVYQVGAHLNFKTIGTTYIQYTCTYTNENGIIINKIIPFAGNGSTIYTGDNQGLLFEIHVKIGTVMTLATTYKSGPNYPLSPAFDVGGEFRRIN